MSPAPTGHSDRSAIGYCIARNRYMKRDELGLIVQMFIVPEHRRSLVASNLLQKMWEQWPAGVKLCSCWCAQDLPANRFWEKCGFRALAFRTGSRETTYMRYDEQGKPIGKTKGHRIHIFWQKTINQANAEVTGMHPSASGGFWFPSETVAGSIGESRLVFPIPPGTSWRDAKPAVLPGVGEMFEALRKERDEVECHALKLLAPPENKNGLGTLTRQERAAEEARKSAELRAAEEKAKAARASAKRGGRPRSRRTARCWRIRRRSASR